MKFSIIVPIYKDTYKYFDTCYKAIKDQDYTNWEIIVVLDGKNKKASKYLEKYKDIKVYEVSHRGAPGARNYGVEKSTGDYITLIDPDIYLYPGTLTAWAEGLEDNPDCGFVYGSYDIVGGYHIPTREFDTYDLGCSNYISGANPIRRELWIPQDEDLKSLQDWNMWLNLADKGIKGKFINKSFFITEKPGNISQHSHNNWETQTTLVRERHNRPKSQICVTSGGAYHHALHVAKRLEADILPDPSHKPHSYKAIYLIGFYPEGAKSFIKILETVPVKIVHWIGTDVLNMRTKVSFEALQSLKKYFAKKKVILLSETQHIYKELKEMGIETKIVPIPPQNINELQPLPKKFVIANYINPTQNMYYEEFVTQIAKSMPDVKWKFFGDKDKVFQDENIEYVGWVDMKEFVKECSALIRLTEHDGLPLSPLEFITAGRNVITNHKFPYMIKVKLYKDEIVSKIRELVDMKQNIEGSKYWTEKLNEERYKKTIYKLCN